MIPDGLSVEDFLEYPDRYIWGFFNPEDHSDNKEKRPGNVTEGPLPAGALAMRLRKTNITQ